MALTPLETIAQKLADKRKDDLESILRISGSAAVSKNEYGVTIVDEQNVASSLVFKPLTKTKIDNIELLKAIDVEVKELKPSIPVANKNLVTKELYDGQVATNKDLTKQVEDLTKQVEDLTSKVVGLKADLKSEINNKLSTEQSNDALSNQLNTLTATIQDFSNQIQSAVQKSVEESILRASLQSQNQGFKAQIEALIKQIDSLNSIIEGLQSQLGAVQQQQAIQQGTQSQAIASGADVLVGNVLVKIKTKNSKTDTPIVGKINGNNTETRWENGEAINIINNDKKDIKVNIKITNPPNINWLSVAETDFVVTAGQSKDINLIISTSQTSGLDSKGKKRGFTGSARYKGGNVDVIVTMADGKSDKKSYLADLVKNHPDDYPKNEP
jgi:predicted  nucleic acid-binding Zn-ribbon protein